MRKYGIISTLALLGLLLPLRVTASVQLSAQDSVSAVRVEADSLVRAVRNACGVKIFSVRDTSDSKSYTVRAASADEFMKKALAELENSGYTVSQYDGGIFVLRNMGISTDLPFDYFKKEEKADDGSLLKYAMQQNVTTTFQNKIYEIGEKTAAKSGKVSVYGYVKDAGSGEPLVGVSVYDEKGAYAMTDAYGYYKISLPVGESKLGFSGYSLEDMKFNLQIYDEGGFDVTMKEKVFSLAGAVITSESNTRHRTPQMGIETIRINAIKNVPVAFGETDVLKVVMTLPGVKTVGEASNGFNVRGGATDQNLILFNNGTIYNPSHMFGLLSAFNADVISDVELYKSSIPVEYGGRIASVLEIRSREGNSNKVTGSLGLGLLTSRLHLEGPLGKKTTFIAGARTTYSDWLLGLIPENSGYSNGSATFQDVNLGLSHKFNQRNSIHAYGYFSRDRFGFSKDTSFNFRNISASLKWRSIFSDRHSMVVTGGYDNYRYKVADTFNPVASYSLSSGVDQYFMKATFKLMLNEHHTLTYGLGTTYYDLNTGQLDPVGEESNIVPRALRHDNAFESAAYASDTWTISKRVTLDAGIRLNNFLSTTDNCTYWRPDYRLSGKVSITDSFSWKVGINTMNQFIHKISNSINISPTDTWKLSGDGILPQEGWQAATGLYATVLNNTLDLSAEVYYKEVKNYLDYIGGARLVMNENLKDELIRTFSRAYGVEFMAKKSVGKLNGWVSYTYSRSLLREMEDRGLQTVNRGEWYNSSYDKPHDVKFVGNYKFTHRYSLSANLDYSTGRPVTLPVSKYMYNGSYKLIYSDRNSYRIPDYFRLDLALIVEPGHYLKKLTHMSFTFGVYNVTGRKNPYSIYYTVEGSAIKGHMLTVLGTQIPYVNFNLKF